VADFLWIEWNRSKIFSHLLTEAEVEFAVRHGDVVQKGWHPANGEYFETEGVCPNGRMIRVVWRYDVNWDGFEKIFVITAY
jgi:hypothetical protein